MKVDSDTRRIIFLAVIAIILMIFIFVYALGELAGGEEQPTEEQYAQFPDSAVDNVPVQPVTPAEELPQAVTPPPATPVTSNPAPATSDDWRDEVVTYGGSGVSETTNAPVTAVAPTGGGGGQTPPPPVFINPYDLIDLDSLDPDVRASLEAKPTFVGPPDVPDAFPTLTEDSRPIDCGSIDLDVSQSQAQALLDDLEDDDRAICLGEATVDDCDYATLELDFGDGVETEVFIVEDNEGQCGVGTAVTSDYVRLCDLSQLLNEENNKDYDFEEWQDVLTQEPGRLLSDLVDAFYSVDDTDYCSFYQLP